MMARTETSLVAPPDYGELISARLDALAAITNEPGKITRLYLSTAHRRAADLVRAWMVAAGMTAQIDAIGNVTGRYAASTVDAPAMLLGSHLDTVRDAGRFDGTLGVVAAIAVVARLNAAGRRLPFAIEVIAFGDEEGVRFQTTLSGSRALAGLFDPTILDERDANGITRRTALDDFGGDPDAIGSLARDPAGLLGYVELHIEQGPVLEAEGRPVAVVTAINGVTRGVVTVTGDSGHAGTVPMAQRRDALAAAAEMILAVERHAAVTPDLVATAGRLDVANPAVNTVPGRVTFSLDIRSPSDAARVAAVTTITQTLTAIAAVRHVDAAVAFNYEAPAAVCDGRLAQALADAISGSGLPLRLMPSGAGHDAMAFRDRVPFAMLFARCRGGISHNPAEYASPADIDIAARVLEGFLLAFTP